MAIDVNSVLKDFSKPEIIDIAKELEVDISYKTPARKMLAAIIEDLEENGVPDSDTVSDTLDEFLYVAGYVDEEGNLLELIDEDDDGSDGGANEDIEEVTETDVSDEDMPECFSFADGRDPACKRCKVFELCKEERAKVRPECFGRLFQRADPECVACMEANSCRQTLKGTMVQIEGD